MKIAGAKKYIFEKLEHISDSAMFEASEILIYATKISREKLLFSKDTKVTALQMLKIKNVIHKRRRGIPLQYLLGEWEFYGIPFKVGRGVLIPRADTELLVDTALEYISKNKNAVNVFDFCAGSGAIGIAVSVNSPSTVVTMVEKSKKAFKYLKKNISLLEKAQKINVKGVRADILNFEPKEKCDLLLSNPPYIKSGDIHNLSNEVKHEPKTALDGGEDGLIFYREICKNAEKYLKPNGKLMFEIGYDEADEVEKIMYENGFFNIEVSKDLGGNDRVVTGDYMPNDINN